MLYLHVQHLKKIRMNTKLTLVMSDDSIVTKAKRYAQKQNSSLSRIVENYLVTITRRELPVAHRDLEITPFVAELNVSANVPVDFDYEQEREKILLERYNVAIP